MLPSSLKRLVLGCFSGQLRASEVLSSNAFSPAVKTATGAIAAVSTDCKLEVVLKHETSIF